jgi:hypothetical protein
MMLHLIVAAAFLFMAAPAFAAEQDPLTCAGSITSPGPQESWFSVEVHKGALTGLLNKAPLQWHPPMTTAKSPLLLGLFYDLDNGRIGALDEIEVYGVLPFDENPGLLSGWIVVKIDGVEAWREPWKAEEEHTLQGEHLLMGSVVMASTGDHQPRLHPERLALADKGRMIEVQGVAADGRTFADAGYDLTDKKQREALFAGAYAGSIKPGGGCG